VVAASLARGLSLDAAAAWGVRAASWSVGHAGVRAPTLADIPLG
jgi:sugar/nucleoside kinase (ribokinase family)